MATNKMPSYDFQEAGANKVRATLDQIPRVSQKLKLICTRCGRKHKYDVGTIFFDPECEERTDARRLAFTNYFHCLDCGSPGPWEAADSWSLLGLALRAGVGIGHESIIAGRCELFDGTSLQTPAMGEEYLRGLRDKDPNNAFLCTRLGNLLRGAGEHDRAASWYERAITLDAGDIEARYHLYSFAVEDLDVPAAIAHALLLVRALLEGRETDKEKLTNGIALILVDTLRAAPREFRVEFLGQPTIAAEPPERRFIRALLEREGDEEKITAEFAARLLDGVTEIPPTLETHAGGTVREVSQADGTTATTQDDDVSSLALVPCLRDLIAAQALDTGNLGVAVEADGQGHPRVQDRHQVTLYDGHRFASWPVASLRELFRGDRRPPADMDHYPEEYCDHFFFIETHLLTMCDAIGDRTDQEMEEIYSALRRRPDGRSLGPVHDFLWQVCALLLGKHALSSAEFSAIAGTLERSVRKWALRPVSRNYVEYLRSHAICPARVGVLTLSDAAARPSSQPSSGPLSFAKSQTVGISRPLGIVEFRNCAVCIEAGRLPIKVAIKASIKAAELSGWSAPNNVQNQTAGREDSLSQRGDR